MVMKVLATSALLIGALLVVDFASEVLQAWHLNPDNQGRLIKPHWVDKPEVGIIV